jgi:hypothetical protein
MIHELTRTLALAAATGAIAAPAASARLPAPDPVTRSTAGFAARPLTANAPIDLRSPDARDASTPVTVDLRSPDAALPVGPSTAHPVAVPSSIGSPADPSGFDLGSAAVGAGLALVVAFASVGMIWALGRRRSHASRRGVAPLSS